MDRKYWAAAALCALLALGLAGCQDSQAGDKVSEAVSKTKDAVSDTVSRVEEGAEDTASRVESFLEEPGSRAEGESSPAEQKDGERSR